MQVIKVNNVNEAYCIAMGLLRSEGVLCKSRGMPMLEVPQPITTVYKYPAQRVCLIPERKANPFFHLFESLWILAGRKDVAWLQSFNKRMREYSDDGLVFHAPYGHRLRYAYGRDQITELIELLKAEPDTRRAVLTIWHPSKDLNMQSKDIPCNDMVFFRSRDGKLDMTVCCRSNDVIWGAYGANVVQFSMLQEYIAGAVGMDMGSYNQVSNSFHIYPDNPHWDKLRDMPYTDFNPYKYEVESFPLWWGGATLEDWNADLYSFVGKLSAPKTKLLNHEEFCTEWFKEVAVPMYNAWLVHKLEGNGLEKTVNIGASDWKAAADLWLRDREV